MKLLVLWTLYFRVNWRRIMSNLSRNRSSVEIADIFRIHAHKLPSLSREQVKVIKDIIGCRTAKLGGHIRECDECGNPEISYNSCRNTFF